MDTGAPLVYWYEPVYQKEILTKKTHPSWERSFINGNIIWQVVQLVFPECWQPVRLVEPEEPLEQLFVQYYP